jgi:hypothetical protein
VAADAGGGEGPQPARRTFGGAAEALGRSGGAATPSG